MKIEDNILRYYLRNCYFINGTAYAGKSTMCRMLAEKYNMLHMEENYETNTFTSIVEPDLQPNLNYFNTMESWQAFVSRTPDEYESWVMGINREIQGFEMLDLHDYLGQGTALVGILDAFWENKGYGDPETFRNYCADTVLLTRCSSYIWKNTDT